jgi:4-hydroxybenzoate polyprenyltransferase
LVNETVSHFLAFSHSRHALLSVAQPALGALLAAQGFPERRTTILGTLAADAGMLCVYASNDLFDLPTDRQEASLLVFPDIAEFGW